jgi:hypothetical protein
VKTILAPLLLNHVSSRISENMKSKNEMNSTQLLRAFQEIDATYYHEAGHTMVGYLLGFRPLRIDGAYSVHDRRTSSFFRYQPGILNTAKARERAADYAVSLVAGVVAESEYTGVPLDNLRSSAGADDYKKVDLIMTSILLPNAYQDSPEVRQSLLQTWEAQAKAMLLWPNNWSAIESLVWSLTMCGGVLDKTEIRSAIREGMEGCRSLPICAAL